MESTRDLSRSKPITPTIARRSLIFLRIFSHIHSNSIGSIYEKRQGATAMKQPARSRVKTILTCDVENTFSSPHGFKSSQAIHLDSLTQCPPCLRQRPPRDWPAPRPLQARPRSRARARAQQALYRPRRQRRTLLELPQGYT